VTIPGARTCLLFLVGVLTASVGTGQPPDAPKEVKIIPPRADRPKQAIDTAFPDLKPPRELKEAKQPDGTTKLVWEENRVVPLPPVPVIAANDPPLRKVQFEQVQEGLDYLARIKALEKVVGAGPDFLANLAMASATFRVAAELETDPAKRVPWLEARVRALKEGEEFTAVRVKSGGVSPQHLNLARFERLQVEADLLKLKAEIEKPKK
jgi:hypothetical protein